MIDIAFGGRVSTSAPNSYRDANASSDKVAAKNLYSKDATADSQRKREPQCYERDIACFEKPRC